MSIVIDRDQVLNGLWCTAALAANLFCCQMLQGKARFPAGERPPEDGKLSMAKMTKNRQTYGMETLDESEANKAAKETAVRMSRVHLNALENVPLGLIVGWATAIASGNSQAQRYFFIAFAVCRWLHTIVYVKQLQPHRALCWLGAWISVIGMLTTAIRTI
eukprot:TRINITY_DN793_c2_g1_i1.p1 TRINITY_DN793_c2_g1~~TRINITY_DN793_c2_g1_i1.p1  ORF type:complete len:161 (+),score=48.52 TRINITY_DN793_c2_g1_i1:101-583(+)